MRTLDLILLLLGLTALLELAARKVSVPRPVLLILGGLGLAFIPGLPRINLDPGVVFLLFIPPLLYRAAITTSFRDFSRNLRPILFLAIVLVLVTIGVVACVARAISPEFTWASAFVLGAIVSPPDAVAAVAVMRRLGAPRRLVTVLEGEGLVNDATALVAYRLAMVAAATGSFSVKEGALWFLYASVGGVAAGLVIGWLVAAVRRRIRGISRVENTLSLLTPFLAYLPADRIGVSGVLSVVTAGLYLGRRAPELLSPATRVQAQEMWDMIEFLLEGLIFILIGLYLPTAFDALRDHPLPQLLGYAALISVVIIVLRMITMPLGALAARALPFSRRDGLQSWSEVGFVSWAGMRGGDSLVIALALPLSAKTGAPFPARDLIVFITFFVILVTLVVQGLTLVPLLRFLGLRSDGADESEETLARRVAMEAGLAHLEAAAGLPDAPGEPIAELRDRHARRLHQWISKDEEIYPSKRRHGAALRSLRRDMLRAERAALIKLRNEGAIGDGALHLVERDLDYEAILLDADDARHAAEKNP